MSLYTALCSRVLFPVHERIKGHDSVGRMHRLESSQWWSAEALREAQARRLNAFLVEIGDRFRVADFSEGERAHCTYLV